MDATFQNTIFDSRCSKCKRTQDPIYFSQHGKVYKTCNECRAKAARRRGIQLRNNLSPEFSAHLARVQPSIPMRTVVIPPDTDDDTASVDTDSVRWFYADTDNEAAVNEILALSSSAAADPSSSSAVYFVEEPDPEPEPEGP